MSSTENPKHFLIVKSNEGIIVVSLASDTPTRQEWNNLPLGVRKSGIVLTVRGDNAEGRAIINATRLRPNRKSLILSDPDNPKEF